MWELPGPGLEPVSPALAGRFLTTVPPGKPSLGILIHGAELRKSFPVGSVRLGVHGEITTLKNSGKEEAFLDCQSKGIPPTPIITTFTFFPLLLDTGPKVTLITKDLKHHHGPLVKNRGIDSQPTQPQLLKTKEQKCL